MTLTLLPRLNAYSRTERAAALVQAGLRRSRPPQDAAEFAAAKLGAEPTTYQRDILRALATRRRVAVRGPHGLGKTALASWAVLWALSTFGSDTKVITTASAWRQLTKFLWPEIRKWNSRWDASTIEMQALNAYCGQAEAFAVASNNPALIEGAHAAKLLYVFDEAKAIPDGTWDAVEGAFSAGECYALAISTPGDRVGRFYDIHRRAPGLLDWWVRHVTLNEAIAAGRVSREWAEQRLKQWGEASPLYQARVLGEFPTQSDDALISLTWIDAAIERGRAIETAPGDDAVIGIDVARYGSDDSTAIVRRGPVVVHMETWHGNDTMQTAGKCVQLHRQYGGRLHVDEIGVGAGVVDRLNELGLPVDGINVGDGSRDKEQFANLRAEVYWGLRQRFYSGDIAIMDSTLADRLTGELTAMKYSTNSRGQTVIESKDAMRDRGLASPDLADALALSFYAGKTISGQLFF